MSGGRGSKVTDFALDPDKVKVTVQQRLGLPVELADSEHRGCVIRCKWGAQWTVDSALSFS